MKNQVTLSVVMVVCLAMNVPQGVIAEEPKSATLSSGKPADGGPALVEASAQVKARVEAFGARVQRRLAAVDEIVRTSDLRRVEPQRLVVGELQELLGELDDEARLIEEAYGNLGPDLRLYRQALEEAPAVFQRIAEDFDAKAAGKATSLFEAYADLAGQARILASAYHDRARGIDGLEADLKVKIDLVRESRGFIKDASQFLAAIPANEGGVVVERLVSRVNLYLETFEETLRKLKEVSGKIAEPEEGKSSKQPTASVKSIGVNATKLLDYRKRVAALVK